MDSDEPWCPDPHPSRSDRADPHHEQMLAAHRDAVRRGDPGYLDPASGLFVFTDAYHRARGGCCDSGCRHCPWVT